MRRSLFVTVLLTAAAFAGPVGYSDDGQASGELRPHWHLKGAAPVPDVVSGCASGAALVKVLIDLQPDGDRCVPEVTPASVCVAPGAVVRFRIENDCPSRGDEKNPALVLSQPKLKPRLLRRLESGSSPGGPDVFQNCSLGIEHLEKDGSHVFHCDIPERAVVGFYKYSLKGQIVTLDPDVEVHQ